MRGLPLIPVFLIWLSIFINFSLADSPQPKILLVLDAHWDPGRKNNAWGIANVAPYYIQALNTLGLEYKNCTVDEPGDNGPGYDIDGDCLESPQPHLKDFDIVIWFTGNDGRGTKKEETLRTFDRNATKYFLDNGGKLFVTGQDIGYECYNVWSPACNNNPFYSDYLHAFWCKDDANDNTTIGVTTNPIGDSLSVDIGGGASNQIYQSIVFHRVGDYLVNSKTHSLYYDVAGSYRWCRAYGYPYGIKCNDGTILCANYQFILPASINNHTQGPLGSKVVYFGFGFEGITGADTRTEIMKRIIGYLRAPDTLGTKIYAEASQIEGVDYIDTSLTCDPTDSFCHRDLPKINATCRDYQLFANVSGAEYYIDTPVQPERFAGNGTPLQAVDGSFNDDDIDEVVEGTVDIRKIQTIYSFEKHNVYVHCNDTDGYWGKYDSYSVYVDRYPPLEVNVTIESGKRYTNKTKPLLTITFSDAKEDIYPHYVRFSCNISVGWTPWKLIRVTTKSSLIFPLIFEYSTLWRLIGVTTGPYPYTFNYSDFDITDTSVGCPSENGNRTIYVQIRDSAGNWHDVGSVASDWIILDRDAPKISEIIPANNLWVKSTDNITIIFYDPILPDNTPGAGVHINYTSNGTAGVTQPLFNNTPFNPGWVNEGWNLLQVWINDTAGNLNYTEFRYGVDNTPPIITWISPQQNSWISLNLVDLTLEVTDSLSGVDNSTIDIIPSSGSIIDKDCTTQITNGYRCTATWNTTNLADGNYTLTIKANDTLAFADNQATLSIDLRVDKTPPQVTINYPPQFYNTTSPENLLNVSVIDPTPGSGVDNSSIFYIFENATGQYNASGYPNVWTNIPLDPSGFYLTTWSAEAGLADGRYAIRIRANDTIDVGPDNQNASVFVNITIDNTPPNTTDNSSSAEPWYSTDQTISLTCTDALVGCHVTLYCIYDDGATPCDPSIPGTSVPVTCDSGSTCVKRIRYRSNDTLGNLEDIKESKKIRIDKQAPSITIDNPLNGTTHSGIINLLTTVIDIGSGVNVSWYEIRNATPPYQIFQSGLLLPPDFDVTWNSTANITNATDVIFNVSANDTFNWTTYNVNVTFRVDNTYPSVIIWYPKKTWLNTNFSLDLRATGVAGNNITHPTFYNITNSTGYQVATNSTSPSLNQPTYNFTELLDITTWYNGNYTISFTANQTNNKNSTEISWFVVDRLPPYTTHNTTEITNNTWYSTDIVVNLTCIDPLLEDGTIGAGCDKTLYCTNTSEVTQPTCASPTVSTHSPLVIASCPTGNTCHYRLVFRSNDTSYVKGVSLGNLGDWNSSYWIKIDKQPPTTIDSTTGLWYATDQTVLLTCSDVGTPAITGVGCNETLYCIDTAGICTPNLVPTNITPKGLVEVNFTLTVTCPADSVCQNYVRYLSNDTLGWLESIKTSKLVKIDKAKPSVILEKPIKGFVNGIIEVRATITDLGSGVDVVNYTISNSTHPILIENSTSNVVGTNVWNGTFNTRVLSDGPYNLTIKAFDKVGNLNDTQKVSIYIDNTPPYTWAYFTNLSLDITYGDYRIYPRDAIVFRVNVSDIANVSKVILNVSKLGVETSYLLSLISGNISNGTWELVYRDTDLIGIYNFTKLFANDSLGNVFINTSVNIPFLVVNGSVEVKLNTTNEIDAGRNKTFNLTFKFNKTFEVPKLSIYIPPNLPTNTSQSPNYINQTSYFCYFGIEGCDVSYGFDTQPYITWMNATGIGNNTSLSLFVEKMKATTPSKDTSDSWVVRFREIDFSNLTKIKTPFLNITRIFCNESTTCIVYQNKAFNLTVEVQNAFIANEHTGDAYEVNASYESSFGSDVKLVNDTLFSGNLKNVTFENLNITEAGNYTFTFKAWEFTKQYNATPRSVLIQVKDTVPPKIISTEWKEDNIFNLNETISYLVKVKDNVAVDKVWIRINQSTGNIENHTLTFQERILDYEIWRSTYANTSWVGNYSILGIYANDTEGNVGEFIPQNNLAWFEVRELIINASVKEETLTVGKQQTIFANVTGNASTIQDLKATILKPRGYVETLDLTLVNTFTDTYPIYAFEANYTNVTQSGNYSINVTVHLFSEINATTQTRFNVSYGNVSISVARDLLYLPINVLYNLTFYIIPENGDLLNVNASLFIENSSVINLTSTQNQSFGNIYWEEWKRGYVAKWEINTTNLGSTNVTLHVNSTTPSIPIDRQNATKVINVTVIPEDVQAPIIIDFGHEWNKINLFEPNRIWINATDNTGIDKVLVEINYTIATKENLTAIAIAPDFYELVFSNANASGNYTYRIFVRDIAGNENVSSYKFFEAFDSYKVNVNTDFSIYNLRDRVKISVEVRNVNNLEVKDFNLTLKLQKADRPNVTLIENVVTEEYTYTISPEDPAEEKIGDLPKTYVVYAEVNKNLNKGYSSTSFKVSKILPVDILEPKGFVNPGSPLNISVEVKNQRGEPVSGASVIVYCTYKNPATGVKEKCSVYTALVPETKSYQLIGIVKAPNVSTDLVELRFEAVQGGNVDDLDPTLPAVILTTMTPAAAPPAVPAAPVTPPCECSNWEYLGCGLGGCKETEMLMIRTCKPAGCALERQCLELPTCISGNFKFELPTNIEIPQGENRKITATLTNIGILPLTINFDFEVEKNVANVSMIKRIELPLKAEKKVEISIHVPLTIEVGEYLLRVVAKSENITKEGATKIIVKKSPYISTLEDQTKKLEELEVKIKEYEKAGVDVKQLKELLTNAKEKVKVALKAIDEDNLLTLRKNVGEIDGIIRDIELRLLALALRKWLYENKWNLIAAAIILIFSNYFVTQVALPYRKLKNEIKKLEEEEKSLVASRIETEKQYFMRKIDEKTFFTLMAEKQGKILRVRGDINRKKKELREFLVKRLHPKTMALWFKKSIIDFAIYLKNLPKLVYEKFVKRKIELKPKLEIKLEKIRKPKFKLSRELKYQLWKIKRKIFRKIK